MPCVYATIVNQVNSKSILTIVNPSTATCTIYVHPPTAKMIIIEDDNSANSRNATVSSVVKELMLHERKFRCYRNLILIYKITTIAVG